MTSRRTVTEPKTYLIEREIPQRKAQVPAELPEEATEAQTLAAEN